MALTRAQLLSGNSSNGVVLPGQPQGVIAGAGISISAGGIISVDASSVTGLVKLNNPTAYNAYVWPNVDGTTGQFLQTDGAGNLIWATAQGFAVVTVQSGAPSPADIGELWFDCATGTLNVYQNCVGTPSPNWFNVSQPGLPVLPANTSAAPPFVSGSGTSAAPYVCNTTTVPVSGSAFVVNTVSVAGLAPFQYVPIADLNGVANGGRFSFSNYYADATGTLTFQTIFNDVPGSPVGTPYTANIKIGYGSAYVDAVVTIVAPLTLAPGTITGTPTVGTAVSYTPGVAAGGTSPYTYTYQWFRDGLAIGSATSSSYTPVAADVGKTLSVTQTVTDFALATASATTTASGVTVYASIPSGTWNPGNTMNTSVPGTSSATWNGATGTVTSSGCVVLSTTSATGPWSTSVTATNSQPLYVQWDMAAAGTCGDAPTGTTITGSVTSSAGQNNYSVTVNRKPSPALPNVSDSNVALGATVSKTLGTTVQGINATAYITLDASSTGTNVKVSLDGGTTFVTVPSAPSTAMPVTLGQTIIIEQTVGSSTTVGYIAAINVGDSTGSTGAASTYQTVTYTATTVSTATFPGVTFSPLGGPNAAPESITGIAGGGTLGTLEGFAPSNAWPAAYATTLSSPVSGANPTMKMRVSPTAYATSGVAVASGQTLDIAWNQAYLDTVTSGSTATGSIQGTVGATTYTNTFTMTVKRTADFTVPTGASGAAGAITISQQTPDNYNVPVKVYQTAGTLTNVLVSINGASAVSLPTSVGTALTINPGDTVAYTATAPAGAATYSTQLHIGDTVKTWSYTVTVTPTVSQPDILNPNDGATGLNPALNSPAGITVDTDVAGQPGGFVTNYGGTQVGADWYIYKAIPFQPTTSAITNVAGFTIITTNNPSGFAVANPPQDALDGSTSTYASLATTNTVFPGGYIEFDVSHFNASYTGAVFTYGGNNPSASSYSYYVEYTDGTTSTPVNPPATAGWFQVSPSGPKTVKSFFATSTVNTPFIYDVALGDPGSGGTILTAPLNSQTTLTLTDGTDLADMVVGDTVTQDSAYTPTTSAITGVSSLTSTNLPTISYQNGGSASGSVTNDIPGLFTPGATFLGQTRGTGAVAVNVGTNYAFTLTFPTPITVTSSLQLAVGFSSGNSQTAAWKINGGAAITDTTGGQWLNTGFTGSLTTIQGICTGFSSNAFPIGAVLYGIYVDGKFLEIPQTVLTLTNDTDLANLQVGDVVHESGSTAVTYSSSLSAQSGFNPGLPATNAFNGVPTSPAGTSGNSEWLELNYTLTNVSSIQVWTERFGTIVIDSDGATSPKTITFSGLPTVAPGGPVNVDMTGIGSTVTRIRVQCNDVAITLLYSLVINGQTLIDGQYSTQGTITAINSVSVPPTLTLNNVLGTWSTTQTAIGPASTGTGTITAISTTSPFSLTLSPSTGAWGVGKTAIDTSRTIVPPAPPALPPTTPDPLKYQAVTGFNPLAITSGTFNSVLVPQADLSVSSKYYASVIYKGSGGTPVVSQAATWSAFSTASSFIPAPGTAYNGGYFGGQINDGGIIYNLIVGPVASAQSGGATPTNLQWKNAATAESNATIAQNQVYGFPMSQIGFAAGAATYPALHFARSVSTGGYNDWYLPAKNELEVLYYFLKPDTTLNNTSSGGYGSNPNAVAPEPVSTNYTSGSPARTTATLFQTGGGQEFAANYYWSSTESSSDATYARWQFFSSGVQDQNLKSSSLVARAIRREYANAPVAIGDAFGGGFFAGQYVDPSDGLTYNLIVAPKASGQYNPSGTNPTVINYKTSATADAPSATFENAVYGKPANDAGNDPTHPAFQWARGLTIATFNDWYIPAKNELALLAYNLNPASTTATLFSGTNTEAFGTALYYASSTQNSSSTGRFWVQVFGGGLQQDDSYNKDASNSAGTWARVVRRVLA